MTKPRQPKATRAAVQTLDRRAMLKATAATAATATLIAAIKASFPAGAFAQGAGPEVKGTKLGYIALTDASPLVIAKEKGFYAKHGVPDMDIAKQASWGATRDNMALGTKANGIDGGHILRPKTHLYATGKVMQNGQPLPMYTLLNLNEDCQAISISGEYKDLKISKDSSPLKEAFAKKKAAGKELTAAMTFPGGTHDLWIRYWLAAGGIDPDNDIKLITVPPPQMVANMKVGTMDCFCVGEPWNEQLVNQDIGYTAVTTGEIWFKHPEKVLGMRADWVDANPRATEAIMMAVIIAHKLGLASSATMMFGHVETVEERIEHLEVVRAQQDVSLQRLVDSGRLIAGANPSEQSVAYAEALEQGRLNGGAFTAFIAWTFQPENTVLKATTVGSHEYLRMQALARIYLDNIPSVQSSWVTQGPEVGQVALLHGANDLGSIMIEENVVSSAGTTFRMGVSDMKRLISELGFEPVQRDNWYRPVVPQG